MGRCLRLVLAAALASLAVPRPPAQCGFTGFSTRVLGPSCNAASTGFCLIVSRPTDLVPTLETSACRLDVDVVAFEGCGATVPLRALLLGVRPAAVPLPFFGPACTLHLDPVVVLAAPAGRFSLPLPPSASPLSFLMQGFALSLPPFGTPIATLSDGVAITVQ